MRVTCPYCGAAQSPPSPGDAGLQFLCRTCGERWGWNGTAAIPVAPYGDPPAVPRQTSLLPPIIIQQRRGWGIGAGFALLLLAVIAVPAEFVIGFAWSLMAGSTRPAFITAFLIPATVGVGIIGLLAGCFNAFTRR